MRVSDGWYLAGPLLAVATVGMLAGVMRRSVEHGADVRREPYADGLAIFGDGDDYGLLSPAAVADDPDLAHAVRMMLADVGIRSTCAPGADGRVLVLVFAEEVEEARRLAGGPAAR